MNDSEAELFRLISEQAALNLSVGHIYTHQEQKEKDRARLVEVKSEIERIMEARKVSKEAPSP